VKHFCQTNVFIKNKDGFFGSPSRYREKLGRSFLFSDDRTCPLRLLDIHGIEATFSLILQPCMISYNKSKPNPQPGAVHKNYQKHQRLPPSTQSTCAPCPFEQFKPNWVLMSLALGWLLTKHIWIDCQRSNENSCKTAEWQRRRRRPPFQIHNNTILEVCLYLF
jgi:hypothetical protein